jgi:hypothetical protein
MQSPRPVEYALRYQSLRSEVWRTYWRNWASERWKYHAVTFSKLIALLLAIFLVLAWQSARQIGVLVLLRIAVSGVILAVASVALLSAFFSQLLFKGSERELVANSSGLSTRIGRLSGRVSWGEVRGASDIGYGIAIQGEAGNFLLVPNRAFPDFETRVSFLGDSRAWLASSKE